MSDPVIRTADECGSFEALHRQYLKERDVASVNCRIAIYGFAQWLDERRAAIATSEWRPINAAPRGGKWVLLWWPGITDCALVGYRGADGWRCPIGSDAGYTEGDSRVGSPTHWMSLPEGPK